MFIKRIFILILLIPLLTACFHSPSIIGKKEISKSDELKKFKRTIKFPTYAPFEINDIGTRTEYSGPQKTTDGEIVPSEEDNPIFQIFITNYVSGEPPDKRIEVHQHDASIHSIKNLSHYNEEKLIEFGNDLKGLYMFNGAVQHFAWEQEGSMFKIVIFVRSEEKHEMEPIPLDEVIKMAESFETY